MATEEIKEEEVTEETAETEEVETKNGEETESKEAQKEGEEKSEEGAEKKEHGKNQEQPSEEQTFKNEKNRIAAEKRREREALEKAQKDGFNQGVKSALKGVNPYTEEKLETDEDIEVARIMTEMEQKGLDPLSAKDFIKYQREEKAKEQQEQERIDAEMRKFYKDNPNMTPDEVTKLLNNDEFISHWDELGGTGEVSICVAYKSYLRVQSKAEDKAKEQAKKIVAKKEATPPNPSNAGEETPKSVETMSREEFQKYYEKKMGRKW